MDVVHTHAGEAVYACNTSTCNNIIYDRLL